MAYRRSKWWIIGLLLVVALPVVGVAQMDPRGALIRVQPEVNFGPVAVGTTATYNYVFTNLTGERATINSVGFDDFVTVHTQDPPHPARAVFEVTGLMLPTTLGPGGQFRFTIRFTPPGVGTYRPKNTLIICVTTHATRQHIHYYIPLVGHGIGGEEEVVPPGALTFDSFTDQAGRFSVPIPILPNTAITGTLTECTVRLLPQTRVSVTLVPKPGITVITRADQIGAVRVSSPGYTETTVTQLLLASSMDMFGRVYTTVGVGTVCLRPTAPPVTLPPVIPTVPITVRTGGDGKFTASPLPGITVTGTLTECGKIPLPNQEFTLTLVPKGEVIATADDITGFTFSVPGYATTTITQFSKLSLFGLTWYDTGPVCLLTEAPPCIERTLRVLSQNLMLIPKVPEDFSPCRDQRAEEVAKLLDRHRPGKWREAYDVICLQEVWHFNDNHFNFKNAVLRGWLGMQKPYLDEKTFWHEIRGDKVVPGPGAGNDRFCDVRILKRNPAAATKIPRVVIVQSDVMGKFGHGEGSYAVIGPDSTAEPRWTWDSGLMILSKYPIVAISAFIFSDQAGARSILEPWTTEEVTNKGALYARIQLDPANPSCYIHIFNTHLAAGEHNARHRQKQIEELLEFIANCVTDPNTERPDGRPILICGDFNVIGGSAEWQARLQNLGTAGIRFKDAWLAAGKGEGKNGATWVGNDQDTTGTPWGNPGGKKEGNVLATGGGIFQRLDYIFFWPGLQPLQLQLLSVAREPDKPGPQPYQWDDIKSYTISDHLGVVGVFKVSPK